jgi:hypothetical protein
MNPVTDRLDAAERGSLVTAGPAGIEAVHDRAAELRDLVVGGRRRTSAEYARGFVWLLGVTALAGLVVALSGLIPGLTAVTVRHPQLAMIYVVLALLAFWLILGHHQIRSWMQHLFASWISLTAVAGVALNGIHGLLVVPLVILVVHGVLPPVASLAYAVPTLLAVGALAMLEPVDPALPLGRMIAVCVLTVGRRQLSWPLGDNYPGRWRRGAVIADSWL